MPNPSETPAGFPAPTPLLEAALTMREWFISFLEAGFTEDQALTLCARMAIGLGNGTEGSSD